MEPESKKQQTFMAALLYVAACTFMILVIAFMVRAIQYILIQIAENL